MLIVFALMAIFAGALAVPAPQYLGQYYPGGVPGGPFNYPVSYPSGYVNYGFPGEKKKTIRLKKKMRMWILYFKKETAENFTLTK